MQRKFVFNLAFIILLNLIIKPFYIFGIDAEVQNQVGTSEYGLYFSLLNLTFLFNTILDFGIANYTSKTVAQHPKLVKSYFSKLFSIKILLFVLYVIAILITAISLGYHTFSLKILSFLIINQFLIGLIQFIRANLTGLHRFKEEALLSILDRSLLIIICSILLWTDKIVKEFNIITFVEAQLLAYCISFLVGLCLIWKNVKPLKVGLNTTYTLSLLKQSAPYAILIFLMFVYNRIDAIMIERLLPNGKLEAGIYAQGFRYLDAVNMIALLFAGLLLPIYARLIKQKKEIYSMVHTPFKLLIPGSILIGILGFYFAKTIMEWRYIYEIDAASLSFSILILSFIPTSITYIFGTLLTANGNLKALNYMALIGVALNLSLNFILIPKYQAYGAAMATLITQSLTALIQIIIAFKIFSFRIDWVIVLKIMSFTLIMIGVNSDWFRIKLGLSIADLNIQLLSYFCLGIFLIFSLRLIKISDFISLVRQPNLKGRE